MTTQEGLIEIHRSPETLARAQGREGLKHDVIPSLEVNRAVLIGVNLRNSFLLAGCSQPLWRSLLSHGSHAAFLRLNAYLSLCIQAEPRRGRLMT